MNEPVIYVACLAAYNNGHNHGVWIDATLEPEDIYSRIRQMLAESPMEGAEAWAIHCHNNFGGIDLGEYPDIEEVHALAVFIQEYDELGVAALELFGDLKTAEAALEDCYLGAWESAADYARDLVENNFEIPDWVAPHVDYEAIARDMEGAGEISTIQGKDPRFHIFSN